MSAKFRYQPRSSGAGAGRAIDDLIGEQDPGGSGHGRQ
jgi:hypothetical protein